MSTLQLTVFSSASQTAQGNVIQEEIVTYTATSVQSNVIDGLTLYRIVRLYSDADCFVTWGSNPTALTNGTEGRYIGANNPEYFSIPSGEKIAVIQRT